MSSSVFFRKNGAYSKKITFSFSYLSPASCDLLSDDGYKKSKGRTQKETKTQEYAYGTVNRA